jgi:hypothetical protein
MRSEIITEALEKQNAFELCHRTFKLVRKSHKPNTRIQETTNDVLQRIAAVDPSSAAASESASPESESE